MSRKLTPLTLYHLHVRRAVASLVAVIAISAFLYGFFLLEAVSHAASHKEARREIAALSGKVGSLQSRYLSATRALTPERARAMGFVSPNAVATVYADHTPLTVSANR